MYSRNRSSGSSPARIAARLAEALISPELVSASIRAVDRVLDLVLLHDLVADEVGVRVAGRPLAAGQDRLAGGAVADEPGQAQVGGAGDDPLLARRQVQAHAPNRDHVVHHMQ